MFLLLNHKRHAETYKLRNIKCIDLFTLLCSFFVYNRQLNWRGNQSTWYTRSRRYIAKISVGKITTLAKSRVNTLLLLGLTSKISVPVSPPTRLTVRTETHELFMVKDLYKT